MQVPALQSRPVDASSLSLEQLAATKHVPESAKVAEASRAFEAILLRQILQESQKPVFASKFTDNSTTAGIYRDLIVNQLAEDISKSGSFGLAKTVAGQLQRQTTPSRLPAPDQPVNSSGTHPISKS